MMSTIKPDGIYAHSEDVVSRVIEGEVIIVPLAAGIGDADDDLFSLNETGCVIWQKLDGKATVEEIVADLVDEYDAAKETILAETAGLLEELLARRMILKV